MYENQKFFDIIPLIIDISIVWINNINPIARGCFICVNIKLIIMLILIIIIISGVILLKILILGIKEEVWLYLWSFKR